MIRLTTFVAFLAISAPLSFGQSSAMTPEREAEIYKTTRSAIIAAKGRAASKDLSVRKAAIARAESGTKASMAKKFEIKVADLEQILRRGELADGTAAKKEAAAGKAMAKAQAQANNQAINEAMIKEMSKTPRTATQQAEAELAASRANRGANIFTGKMPATVIVIPKP